jgi:hypothetical protein
MVVHNGTIAAHLSSCNDRISRRPVLYCTYDEDLYSIQVLLAIGALRVYKRDHVTVIAFVSSIVYQSVYVKEWNGDIQWDLGSMKYSL